MIGGVTRQGGLPGLLGRVTFPAGVAFCHVNLSRWGSPPTQGRFMLPKRAKSEPTTKRPPYWNRNNMSRSRGYQRGELFRRVHLSSVERRNHAVFSKKLTPGPRGDKIACKRELFFDHGWAGHLTYPGSLNNMALLTFLLLKVINLGNRGEHCSKIVSFVDDSPGAPTRLEVN